MKTSEEVLNKTGTIVAKLLVRWKSLVSKLHTLKIMKANTMIKLCVKYSSHVRFESYNPHVSMNAKGNLSKSISVQKRTQKDILGEFNLTLICIAEVSYSQNKLKCSTRSSRQQAQPNFVKSLGTTLRGSTWTNPWYLGRNLASPLLL